MLLYSFQHLPIFQYLSLTNRIRIKIEIKIKMKIRRHEYGKTHWCYHSNHRGSNSGIS
jgi:hypothetical protein